MARLQRVGMEAALVCATQSQVPSLSLLSRTPYKKTTHTVPQQSLFWVALGKSSCPSGSYCAPPELDLRAVHMVAEQALNEAQRNLSGC
jgi:hypothetical protein